MTQPNLKWPIVGSLVIYMALLVMRTACLRDSDPLISSTDPSTEDKSTDISDSRRSNWGSDSRDVGSSDVLAVDRVFPLTRTLNLVMENICRRFRLYIQLESKNILYLKNDPLNFTLRVPSSDKKIFAMNPVISRLDSIRRLGNAFVSLNTDTTIILVQKLRFKILKFKYDYYDCDFNSLGHSSLILLKNTFLLNVTLSTNADNSECQLENVELVFVPDKKSSILKCEGPIKKLGFDELLKMKLYNKFLLGILVEVKSQILPFLIKVVDQTGLCCYFDAKLKKPNEVFDFSSDNVFYG